MANPTSAIRQRFLSDGRLSADLRGLGRSLRAASPAALAIPGLTIAAIVCSLWSPWYGLACKDFQEVFAPSLLLLAAFLAAGLAAVHRHSFLKWQAILVFALFCRELHFFGTNNGIYVILLVLLWYFARHFEPMQPFASNRRVATLLWGALWVYAIAKVFDRGYGRKLIPGLEPLRDSFEESLESTGHLLILSMVLASAALCASLRRGATAHAGSRPRILRPAFIVTVPLLLLVLALVLPSRAAISKTDHGALCELSSLETVPAAPGLFLASSDEQRSLVLCSLDSSGNVVIHRELPLSVPLGDGSSIQLDDLEDLAFDGQQTYYAVTSHREFSDKKEAQRFKRSGGTQRALVSFELERTDNGFEISNARVVCRDLLDQIRERCLFESVNFHYSKILAWRHLATTWQIDLEGLAFVDGQLLLGFKNPVEDGKAAILCYDPASHETRVCGRYDFRGQGILALAYDREHDRLLALTNDPFKDSVGDSCLWIGRRGPKPGKWIFPEQPSLILERANAGFARKASGLALAEGRLFVSFDDPNRPVIRSFPEPELSSPPPARSGTQR